MAALEVEGARFLVTSAGGIVAFGKLRAMERRRSTVVLSVMVLVLLALALSWCAKKRPHKPSAPAEGEIEDYLTEKARALDFDPARIRAFVQTEIANDDYQGVLRGPVGTLWAGAGNDLDRDLLLTALLERAGEAREPTKIDDGLWHKLEIRVKTTAADSKVTEESLTVTTASLAGSDIRIAFKRDGARAFASLTVGDRTLTTTTDAVTARRQDVIFHAMGPGVDSVKRRELFTREIADFPSSFDPDDRHSVVVTTGWVPDSVRIHEAALARREKDAGFATAHLVAYTFLARSDATTKLLLASHAGLTARVLAPRITIASSTVGAEKRRGVSLDLRKNDLDTRGPEDMKAAFATARSLLDGALEARVLEGITGAPAVSADELLADALGNRQATLAERQGLLQRTLARLLDEARPGASLGVAPEGKEAFSVRFDRKEGGLEVHVSEAVREAVAATGSWIASSPTVGKDTIEKAAQETEVALAVSAKLPMRYRLRMEYAEAPPRWYLGSRILTYEHDGRLYGDQHFDRIAPSAHATQRFYIDWKTEKFYDQPNDSTVTISAEDAEHAKTFTWWWMFGEDAATGRTTSTLSRDAYRELVERGVTTLRHKNFDGGASDPLTLYLVDRGRITISLDRSPYAVPVLVVQGDFEKDRPDRRHADDPISWRQDQSRAALNVLTVLDDPDFPYILGNLPADDYTTVRVQSSITGCVLDRETGEGVPEARVAIPELQLAATSWPDGRFAFPSSSEAFAEREVTAEAPEHAPLRERRDFRLAETLPLEVRLAPVPRQDGVVWIDSSSLAKLAGLPVTERTKRLIAEAIADDGSTVALVPTFPIPGPYGPIDAWFEHDLRTHEVYGRLDDGLYGTTADYLLPTAHALPHATINYFSGRITAWYLFATGAVEAVALHIDQPGMTLADMHREASRTARALAKLYEGRVIQIIVGAGEKPFLIGGKVMDAAFLKGLNDGLDWCDELYRKAWGL